MLDSVTKRRIDTCRDILVGKIPDPKSQVEQITIALIYKFMDDMDLESEELGGERKFFTGDFERYAWGKLVAPGTSGQDMLNTYGEALQRMTENEKLPALFRDIFRNAYLPYRDPETLRSFLREIDGFTYDHSERLGDAFEYLLSVLGSQGDAGQFRTPRHIIDLMVEIIDPKKDDVILDPACGTAGFLISSYKHILKANSSAAEVDGNSEGESAVERPIESPLRFSGDLLTTEDRQRLARNIKGYDISPDMVRLSLVNLYLHGFANPRVEEYDTLTSEDKWSEMADVILANPPFMSPKGGIRPHKRFSIEASRSEVLFVDYIAEHLTPNGRAAVIVPEGVIFQSGNAYKALRKMLVEKFLVAVVSLPAGVFNPYSGVKTSILIFDRSAAKASDTIAFFKIGNDGFNLGAQRRPIPGSDLPGVLAEIADYRARGGQETWEGRFGRAVTKSEIAKGGDYSLSSERYRSNATPHSAWPLVPLDEVCRVRRGATITQKQAVPGDVPVVGGGMVPTYHHDTANRPGGTITISGSGASAGFVNRYPMPIFASDCTTVETRDESVLLNEFAFRILKSKQEWISASLRSGSAQPHVYASDIAQIQIPLPPLDVQREIVTEIERYQKVIDGARAVLAYYRSHIAIDPEWPTVTMREIAVFTQLGLVRSKAEQNPDYQFPYVKMNNITYEGALDLSELAHVQATGDEVASLTLQDGDFLYNTRNSPDLVGKSAVFHGPPGTYFFNNNILRIRFSEAANPDFINTIMRGPYGLDQISRLVDATTSVAAIYQKNYLAIPVPLPSRDTQDVIMAELEAERALIEANRALVAKMEAKIEATIARVWGKAKEAVREEAMA